MEKDDAYVSFIRSLVLRILDCPKGRAEFISTASCADVDVADMLRYDLPYSDDEEGWKALRERFMADFREERLRPNTLPIPDPLRRNLRVFQKRFGLTDFETQVFLFAILRNEEETVADAMNVVSTRRKDQIRSTIARCWRVAEERVLQTLSGNGFLVSSGLVKATFRGLRHPNLELINERFARSFFSPDFNIEEALHEVAVALPSPVLKMRDYPHLSDKCRRLRDYLRNSLRDRRKGVNVLLYGPPGTGKSELARIMGKALRLEALEVSAIDEDHQPVRASSRLENLRLAQRLFAGRRVLLVFDECEDVFRGESKSSRGEANQQKAWMNRMLESNPVPTIWISNAVWAIDNAFLRRYDMVIEMPALPRSRRVPVYRKICGERISPAFIRQLAKVEEITPAVVSRAVEVAKVTSSSDQRLDEDVRSMIVETVRSQGRETTKLKKRADELKVPFREAWLNSEPKLGEVRTHLSSGKGGCRICLYGPPGTGKTAFGRWLAECLGKPLHVKRASDILGPFVGMTEIRLARAFEKAESDEAVLMIDEVDSLLMDRSQSSRSWEVTQVNEFLTQMEDFSGILVCSTNAWESLDPACLRRFDLKAGLGYLTGEQIESISRTYLRRVKLGRASSSMRTEIAELQNATPGDFAALLRRHRFSPFGSADAFLEGLIRECAQKRGAQGRRMGFRG